MSRTTRGLVYGFLFLSSLLLFSVIVSATTNANEESHTAGVHHSPRRYHHHHHHRHLQSPVVATTTTTTRKGAPPPTINRTCNDQISVSFQRKVLLTLEGRPGMVTNKDVDALQKSLKDAYHQVGEDPVRLACHPNRTIRAEYKFDKLIIDKDQFIAFRQSFSGNLTQPFTITASIQGHCKACLASTFQMFINDVGTTTRRRSLARKSLPRAERSEPSSSWSSSSSLSSSSSQDHRHLAAATKAPKTLSYLPTCQCAPPSKQAFLQLSNVLLARRKKLYTPLSLLTWQELVVHPCSSRVTVLTTYVTLNFGTPPPTTNASAIVLNATIQSQLLARYISNYYNSANALRTTGQVCDTTFLTLTGTAQALVAPNSSSSTRRRHLASTLTSSRGLSSLYKLTGVCRGCSKSTTLFNDAVSKGRRRFLREFGVPDEEYDYDEYDELYTSSNAMTLVDEQEEIVEHRQLPVLDNVCYCPVNSTSFAPPKGTEYLQVLNTQLGVLATSGFLSIVGSAQATVQVKKVKCSTNVQPFSTHVSITVLRVNDTGSNLYNTSLTTVDQVFLEQAFAVAYNFLQSHYYCDPFFRTVETVQLVESLSYRRELQSAVVPTYNFTELVFNVTGTCRGCNPINTTLFQDSVVPSRRRLVQRLVSGHDMLSSGDLVDTRLLQQQNGNVTTCYCPVSVVRQGAPTLAELITAFNQTIASLDNLIVSLAEEDKTLPPTTSPSTFPSEFPSAFPSVFPTALPTTSPTASPTTSPTALPTSPPSPIV